ncbi:hypothetical protein BRY73_24595 [Ochrobactrum sp. P6BS-III]|uniref:hypothetical protein n=1 Tax=unclassified Ochrobactrum TaxID=239106 RepID=UPI000991E05F|nr:hypothetical protein [Ochrobactrum sp. P6BSIII]OOL13608.1 hypothetical protein BRY73_24595 [Ochrobactrum sp. P6BS-III]
MQIDHDQNEPKIDRDPFPWWLGGIVAAVLWLGFIYYGLIEWYSALLGIGTGCILAIWAIEKTGNRTPDSWRTKR